MRTVLTSMVNMFVRTNKPTLYRTVDEVWRSVIFFSLGKNYERRRRREKNE